MKKLVDGVLVSVDDDEKKRMEETILKINNISSNMNEPVDRTRITDEVKQELKQMVNEYPATKVILKILLGNKETNKILES